MGAVKNLSDRSVPIHDPGGRVHHVLPGDVFPDYAVVANESVLGDQELPDATLEHYREQLAELEGVQSARAKRQKAVYQKLLDDADARAKTAKVDALSPDDDEDAPGPERAPGDAPPRKGLGSGIDAWRDYALDQEVDVQQEWTKEQIIAELEAAGKL